MAGVDAKSEWMRKQSARNRTLTLTFRFESEKLLPLSKQGDNFTGRERAQSSGQRQLVQAERELSPELLERRERDGRARAEAREIMGDHRLRAASEASSQRRASSPSKGTGP